jgi:hypothetical protein
MTIINSFTPSPNAPDIDEETAQRVTQILKADVAWLIQTHGLHRLDPNGGLYCAPPRSGSSVWRLNGSCGTCLVGAHMLRNQPDNPGQLTDYEIFARENGIPMYYAAAIYFAATLSYNARRFPRCAKVAMDVLDYAMNELGWHPGVCDTAPFNTSDYESYAAEVDKALGSKLLESHR